MYTVNVGVVPPELDELEPVELEELVLEELVELVPEELELEEVPPEELEPEEVPPDELELVSVELWLSTPMSPLHPPRKNKSAAVIVHNFNNVRLRKWSEVN